MTTRTRHAHPLPPNPTVEALTWTIAKTDIDPYTNVTVGYSVAYEGEGKYYHAWGEIAGERLRVSPVYRANDAADPENPYEIFNRPFASTDLLGVTNRQKQATMVRATMLPDEAAPSDMITRMQTFRSDLGKEYRQREIDKDRQVMRSRQDAADLELYESWLRGKALYEAREQLGIDY